MTRRAASETVSHWDKGRKDDETITEMLPARSYFLSLLRYSMVVRYVASSLVSWAGIVPHTVFASLVILFTRDSPKFGTMVHWFLFLSLMNGEARPAIPVSSMFIGWRPLKTAERHSAANRFESSRVSHFTCLFSSADFVLRMWWWGFAQCTKFYSSCTVFETVGPFSNPFLACIFE